MDDTARMKSSRPSTRQILRLLRFAGVMLLLGSVASASAQTVGERMKKDPSFRIYPVIFGVTATGNSTPKFSVKNYMSDKVGCRWFHRSVRPIIVAHQGQAGSRSWPNPCRIAG